MSIEIIKKLIEAKYKSKQNHSHDSEIPCTKPGKLRFSYFFSHILPETLE